MEAKESPNEQEQPIILHRCLKYNNIVDKY